MQPKWVERLDRCLGTPDWQQAWYRPSSQTSLFGEPPSDVKVASIDAIEAYFLDRLRTVFPTVAPRALTLRNSRGYKMFSLCFASGNGGRGGEHALRIANHLIKKMSD